ncbi:MAG: lipoprotein signal peptidase [Neisseriales bacterium]|nr:MAG: lipoprotein signal peptidase [Neisseriales bacterium]
MPNTIQKKHDANPWQWLGLAGVMILLDQLSKITCRAWLAKVTSYEAIPGFFKLSLYYNTGAAFSFLSHETGWQIYLFAALAIIMAIWLIRGIWRGYFVGMMSMSAALILGGAIGNLIDRCLYGYVTDFLVFYYQQYTFPAFNLADSCITLGALGFLINRPATLKRS